MCLASATGLSTAQTIARFTLRRGSLLRFDSNGGCAALRGGMCAVHTGRPLACRLYPLGMERTAGGDRFVRLEAAPGSIGIYGIEGTVGDFLLQQGVEPYFDAFAHYAELIAPMRARIQELVDFDRTNPSEFRRVAVREALAETGYDYNRLIEALFDSHSLSGFTLDAMRSPERHIAAIARLIEKEENLVQIAAAAVLLAVSIGYTPGVVFDEHPENGLMASSAESN